MSLCPKFDRKLSKITSTIFLRADLPLEQCSQYGKNMHITTVAQLLVGVETEKATMRTLVSCSLSFRLVLSGEGARGKQARAPSLSPSTHRRASEPRWCYVYFFHTVSTASTSTVYTLGLHDLCDCM